MAYKEIALEDLKKNYICVEEQGFDHDERLCSPGFDEIADPDYYISYVDRSEKPDEDGYVPLCLAAFRVSEKYVKTGDDGRGYVSRNLLLDPPDDLIDYSVARMICDFSRYNVVTGDSKEE